MRRTSGIITGCDAIIKLWEKEINDVHSSKRIKQEDSEEERTAL